MRIKFDDAMHSSNHLIMEEWKAMGTARRLQAENDQLLDALLDFNSQPRVSARQRFDLSDVNAPVCADPYTPSTCAELCTDTRRRTRPHHRSSAATITRPARAAQQLCHHTGTVHPAGRPAPQHPSHQAGAEVAR